MANNRRLVALQVTFFSLSMVMSTQLLTIGSDMRDEFSARVRSFAEIGARRASTAVDKRYERSILRAIANRRATHTSAGKPDNVKPADRDTSSVQRPDPRVNNRY